MKIKKKIDEISPEEADILYNKVCKNVCDGCPLCFGDYYCLPDIIEWKRNFNLFKDEEIEVEE